MTFENSAAYIQGWIERLKNNLSVTMYASTQAQRATDFILNVKADEVES